MTALSSKLPQEFVPHYVLHITFHQVPVRRHFSFLSFLSFSEKWHPKSQQINQVQKFNYEYVKFRNNTYHFRLMKYQFYIHSNLLIENGFIKSPIFSLFLEDFHSNIEHRPRGEVKFLLWLHWIEYNLFLICFIMFVKILLLSVDWS